MTNEQWNVAVRAGLGLEPLARLPHELYRKLESLYLMKTSPQDAINVIKGVPQKERQ